MSRMKRRFTFMAFGLLVFGGSRAWADSLMMTDGSVVHGNVLDTTDTTVRIETVFAGVLTVQRQHVQRVETTDANESDTPDLSDASDAVPVWHYEVSADFSRESGNTDSMDIGGAFKASYELEPYRAQFEVRARDEEDNGETTKSEIVGELDVERFLSERQAVYANALMEHDETEELDFGAELGAGYRHYLILQQDPVHELSVSAGLTGRYEEYQDDTEQTDLALKLQAKYKYRLSEWSLLTSKLSISPTLDQFSDYRLSHESALEIAMFNTKNMKLRSGYVIDYDSRPVDGVEKKDTRVFTEFVYAFD